jgi:hypothetical protein
MVEKLEGSRRAGTFTIPPGRPVYGEITYAGPGTLVYLRDGASFDTHTIEGKCLNGTLHDLTKVTLLHCITPPVCGHASRATEEYYFAELFPHFMLHGDRHISNDEKVIAEVQFLVDDASTLFYDFDAFGTLIDARPTMEEIVRAVNREREKWGDRSRHIQAGPHPVILYFTGRGEILSTDTVLGKVHARHHTSLSLGGPDGVSISSRIFTGITFKEPCSFDDAIIRTSTLLRFLELVVGRPQNVLSIQVRVRSEEEVPCILDVYWSMRPRREVSSDMRPQPADILMNGGTQPEEFGRVLSNWLMRDETWRDARFRFSSCFSKQNHYSIDRLIGAANMFDILPPSAVPPDVPVTPEVKAAKDTCGDIWKGLPKGPEQHSVLSVLGRLGKCTLKHKIRHRGKLVTDEVGERFPDLDTVTDEAVNCRNYYVHGGVPRFDYERHPEVRDFFTDTLEFVFATSDLIEAGWDVKAWCGSGTSMSHPFARFGVGYKEDLRRLKSLIPRS